MKDQEFSTLINHRVFVRRILDLTTQYGAIPSGIIVHEIAAAGLLDDGGNLKPIFSEPE